MSSPQSMESGKVKNFSYANTIEGEKENTNITIAESPGENVNNIIMGKEISSSSSTRFTSQKQQQRSSSKCCSYLKYTILTLVGCVTLLFILSISGIIHVDDVFPLSTFKQPDAKSQHDAYLEQAENMQRRQSKHTNGNSYENANESVYSPETINVNKGEVYEAENIYNGNSNNKDHSVKYETMNEDTMNVSSTFVPLSTWSHRRFLEHSPEGWQYDDSIQMLRKIDKHFDASYNHYSNQGEVLVPVSCSIPVPLYERNKNFQEKGHPVAKDYRGAPATRQQLYSAMERDAVKYRQYLTATGKHVGSWLEPATDIGNYRRLFVDVDEEDDQRRDRDEENEKRFRGKESKKSHFSSRKQEIEIGTSGALNFDNKKTEWRKEKEEHHARHLLVGEGYYYEEDGLPYFMYKDTTYFIEPSPTGPYPWPEGVQPVDAVGDDGYFWIYREMGEQAAFMQCFLKIEAVKYGPYFQEFMRFGTFQTPFYDY